MEKKESPSFCKDCPLFTGPFFGIEADVTVVASDPRRVRTKKSISIPEEATSKPQVKRRNDRFRLSRVFIIYADVMGSKNSQIPIGTRLGMPIRSLRRNREKVDEKIKQKVTLCKGPIQGIKTKRCHAAELIGSVRRSKM